MPLSVAEEAERNGPKAGINISLEQANMIIQRHMPSRHATRMSHIANGYSNRVYSVTTVGGDDQEEDFILRLSGRFWQRFKTEHEVCVLLYLTKRWPSIIAPKVFGYCTDKDKSGINAEYILMEKLKGAPLGHVWYDIDLKAKMRLIDQLAKLCVSFKKVTFDEIGAFHFASESIGNSSGIGVDPQRDIVDGEDGILKIGKGVQFDGGPYSTFLDYFRSSCETEVRHLRECDFMKGAEGYEKRLIRIEKFIEALKTIDTLPEILRKDLENVSFVFSHGDLDEQNILVDRRWLKITGLIDFEWGGSYPVDEEWFSGFSFVDANTTESRAFNEERPVDDPECESQQEKKDVDDFIREYFLTAMRKNGVAVPDDVPGHLVRAELFYFKGFICPWRLREKRDPIPESYYRDRIHACKRVDAVLDKYGF